MTTRTTLPVGSLSRRQLLTVVIATPLIASLLAACGSDAAESNGSAGSDPTTPTGSMITFPTGADEVVVRIDSGVGAYTTPEYSFARIPTLVVAGDGTTVTPGPQLTIYPAPMLPALQSTTLDSTQITELLSRAESLGLLAAPPDYVATQPPVADAGSTVVTISANGETYVHDAPALGVGDTETDPARARLTEFVEFASALVSEAAGEASVVLEPEQYALGTLVVNVSDYTGDIAPTVVSWPEAFGDVPLGDGCSTVDGTVVREALASANQLTFFDVTAGEPAQPTVVQLLLRPLLPGSETC